MRSESSEHVFFWILRKLMSKLQFNGQLLFQYSGSISLGEIFFFPADFLGAIGSPIDLDSDDVGFSLRGVHEGGIAKRAGLTIDDVLLLWDQHPITNLDYPWKYFKGHPTQQLSITYRREDKTHTVDVPCAGGTE